MAKRNKRTVVEERWAKKLEEGRKVKEKFAKERHIEALQAKTLAQKAYLKSLKENIITVATGHSGCVDAETEFLSQDGWKKISEYNDGDKVMQVSQMGLEATLVEPISYIKKPCEWFYAIKSERGSIDQWLSPDHNVAYSVRSKTRLNKKNIEDVLRINDRNKNGFEGTVPCVYDYSDGFNLGLSENHLRLAVALKADGYLQTESTGYYTVRLKKERKIKRLKYILDSMDYDYNVRYQESTGYEIFTLRAPWCSKRLSDWMMCSKEDAQIIMDEYSFWDGDVNPIGNRMSRFSTTIKEEADAMQYFGNICGFRSTISISNRAGEESTINGKEYSRKSVNYNVLFTSTTHVELLPYNKGTGEKTYPEKVPSVDGYKYCFTVPSGYLVLRRNDKVFVTGNSGKTFCATYRACQLLNSGLIDRIIITRPYAHLGKDAGAVPGGDFEKYAPMVRPMLDVCKKTLGEGKYNYCIEKEIIEIAPLEKIQGRSFDEPCAIIADEMQNATRAQSVSLMTRLGEEVAFLAICGDPRQSIKKEHLNTLDWTEKFLLKYKIGNVGVIRFTENDCVRSGMVREILVALENEGGYYTDLE